MDFTNSHMLDTVSAGLNSEELEFRRCVGEELSRSMRTGLRHSGFRAKCFG
jgi:hypothetical protein